MENLQWLGPALQQHVAAAFWSVTGNILFYAALGLFIGIAIVVIAVRKKAFKRPYPVWSFFAGLNYAYIPILLMLFGGAMGSVRGVHKATAHFVEDTATPLVAYGQKYISHIQSYLQQVPWEQYPDMTLDDAIAFELTNNGGLQPGSKTHDIACLINLAVVNHVLDEMDIPAAVRNPVGVARELKTASLGASAFVSYPATLRQYCNEWFSFKYMLMGGLFLPFLLLPVGEFAVYLIYQRMNRTPEDQ